MVPTLRILIVDANQVRASIIEEGLREAGYQHLIRIAATTGLVAAIEAHDPDVVVIDLEDPSRDALADMFLVSRHIRRPITMFVDQSDSASIEAAVEAGVSAYIVDGLKKERMQPILQTCISRFNAFRRLREELDEARSQLEDRKTIDHPSVGPVMVDCDVLTDGDSELKIVIMTAEPGSEDETKLHLTTVTGPPTTTRN